MSLDWCVEDSTVAEISPAGMITPLSTGKTVISCTDGVNTAYCELTVVEGKFQRHTLRLVIDKTELSPGDTCAVSYNYTGPGTVTVYSGSTDVLVVENGICRAIAPGKVVLSCTDGIYTSQCMITVTEASPAA
jgi:hypothetical protein